MSREKILCGKEEIFRVAIDLFERKGLEALTVRNIAKELGVSPMTIYNYVENLKDIKRRVLINGFDQMYAFIFEQLNTLPAPVDKYTFCKTLAVSIFRFAIDHQALYTYMFSEGQRLFGEDAEIRPLYSFIAKLTKRAKATQADWQENAKGYRLLEMLAFSVSYQVSAGAQTLTEEEYGDLIDFYLKKCIT